MSESMKNFLIAVGLVFLLLHFLPSSNPTKNEKSIPTILQEWQGTLEDFHWKPDFINRTIESRGHLTSTEVSDVIIVLSFFNSEYKLLHTERHILRKIHGKNVLFSIKTGAGEFYEPLEAVYDVKAVCEVFDGE